MRILVTGANGQLGLSLRKVAAAHPEHTLVCTDLPEADITDRGAIEALVEKNGTELIINCAAYTAVDKAESDEQLARTINAGGPRTLAAIARERGIGLIHISTDYVFSGEGCRPLREDDPAGPTGAYGRTKFEGELSVRESGCDAAVVRTSWLYSEFGVNFVRTMLRLGAEREALSVVYDQVGTPTYAPDLADALLQLASRGISGYEVYHYSNEGVASWYDFAWEIFSLAGLPVRLSPIESSQYPTPARRPAYSVLAKEKIKSLGIAVPYWKDSLQTCLNAIQL